MNSTENQSDIKFPKITLVFTHPDGKRDLRYLEFGQSMSIPKGSTVVQVILQLKEV